VVKGTWQCRVKELPALEGRIPLHWWQRWDSQTHNYLHYQGTSRTVLKVTTGRSY